MIILQKNLKVLLGLNMKYALIQIILLYILGGYLVKDLPKSMPMPKGGILADEMGLGKTVEVLSCMLCNPRTDIPKPEPLEVINISKGQLISECLFDVLNFPKNQRKI